MNEDCVKISRPHFYKNGLVPYPRNMPSKSVTVGFGWADPVYRLKILLPYFLYFLRNKLSKSVTVGLGRACFGRVGSGWFIVLNDSASPKMVIKIYFSFLRFL